MLLALMLTASGCTDSRPRETTDDGRRAGGPLEPDPAYVSFYEMGPVGARFSEGFQMLRPGASMVVESVEVEGGDTALEYLGARIGLPGRPDDFNQFMAGFPPKAVPARFHRAAPGTRLEPGERYMLIIGYRVKRHVMDLRMSVTVNYQTTDGDRYAREFPARVLTCPPPQRDVECDPVAQQKYPGIV